MKFHKVTLALLFLGMAGQAWAQKSKVLSAYKYEQAYLSTRKCDELAKASEAIELGAKDEVSSTWAKTWYYRGNIYYNAYISEDDACKNISNEALDLAYQSYVKALELDEKERYKDDINPKLAVISSYFLQQGASFYNKKAYGDALSSFEKCNEVAAMFNKVDTNALYNSALSAEKVKNYGKAVLYYEGLIDINYGGPKIYYFLANAHRLNGDSEKARQAIVDGRKAYPDDEDLILDELGFYLQNDQSEEALENLALAIEKSPSNPLLHFAKGTVYDKLGDLSSAEAAYKEALALDATYFDANYNLGALYFNKGVEMNLKANEIAEADVKNFKAAEAEARRYFDMALPYLETAHNLDPNDKSTLISLKKLYSMTSNDEGYNRIKDLLDN